MKVPNASSTSNRRIPFKNPTALILEDEYISKNPQEVKNLVLKDFHFVPKDFRKTQKFYGFILVDSKPSNICQSFRKPRTQ